MEESLLRLSTEQLDVVQKSIERENVLPEESSMTLDDSVDDELFQGQENVLSHGGTENIRATDNGISQTSAILRGKR